MYEHDELTYAIIGAAIAVHSELGPGLLEHIYENAMCIEFKKRAIRFEQQKRMSVAYRGEIVGDMYADLIVENKVIIELKSVKELTGLHRAQLITYLKVAKLKTGLLINFNVLSIKKGINRISV